MVSDEVVLESIITSDNVSRAEREKCNIEVIDLFCGVGGLTHGILESNLIVKAGFDFDGSCKYAYEKNNPGVEFFEKDIRTVTVDELEKLYSDNCIKVLVGCAPCQPFSTLSNGKKADDIPDTRWNLLDEFGRLVSELLPAVISMENVPRIAKTDVFKKFIEILVKNGYQVDYKIVYCPEYGIPQGRKRMVLLASRLGKIKIPAGTFTQENYIKVQDVIGHLPTIGAGETSSIDFLHKASKLNDKNMERIKKSVPGGSWEDWDDESLIAECHKKTSGNSYKSVYARMKNDDVAPTLTTQFYRFGTGRFGHPIQNRALSLREGALLQTFPPEYEFCKEESEISFTKIGRHIGNAVPVKLGLAIGTTIYDHIHPSEDAQ